MTPHTHSTSRRVPVRRAAAVLAAILVIGGTPLVAQALGEELVTPSAERIEVEPGSSSAAPTEQRLIERAIRGVSTVPDLGVELDAEPAAHEPASAPEPVVSAETVPVPVLPIGPDASQWAALRQCESNGNYAITNPSGKYRGAYQFDRSTWNSVAERHASYLVGVDPAAASPADQDLMAFALYSERGARPWPHCGRHLA